MIPDRLPPHSFECETGIIGCVLLSGKIAIDDCLEQFAGNTEVFYDLRHRVIFDAARTLTLEGHPVDLITMQHALVQSGELERVGGLEYLCRCQDAVPSAANLPYYAQGVMEAFLCREIIRRCTEAVGRVYDGPHNMVEELDRLETDILGIRQFTNQESSLTMMKELMKGAINTIESYHQNQGKVMGIPSGLSDLDTMTCGFHPGEMIVIAARPSMGKTALAMQIAVHATLKANCSAGVFSMEMSSLSLAVRSLCAEARVNIRDIRNGHFITSDFQKLINSAGKLSKSVIAFDDATGLTIETLRAKARRMYQRHNIKLLVIDYIQLMRGTRRNQNREAEIAEISRGIKCLAKELRIPIIALSQLNREIEKTKRKPNLSDLRESGAIEQDADIVGMLYQPLEKSPPSMEEKPVCPTNLLIAKHRNGPTGEVRMMFVKQHTYFEQAAKVDAGDVPDTCRTPYTD